MAAATASSSRRGLLLPFAAGQQPQHHQGLGRGQGTTVLARRLLDFQRLLVATEGAAERHHQQLSGLSSSSSTTGAEAEAEARRCQLELNRLLVVRTRRIGDGGGPGIAPMIRSTGPN